jgi:branched-chain amino acid aminotransferase
MLTIDYSKENGWHKPVIQPYGPISLETSATVLHYGISAHEAITVCENSKTKKLQAFRVKDHLD